MKRNWLQSSKKILTELWNRSGSAVLCTYCFQEFWSAKAPFRCHNLACSKLQPDDPVINSNWPMLVDEERGLIVEYAKNAACASCKYPLKIRICPHCHHRLINGFEEAQHEIIALVGSKFSGKSHVIASMIHEINATLSKSTGLLLSSRDDQTRNRYANDYEAKLYTRKETLDVTNSAANLSAFNRLPLLYTLTQNSTRNHAKLRAITLALFDGAGEDFVNADSMDSITRYINKSSGIILLMDPMQEPGIREKHPNPTALQKVPSTREILSRIIENIRSDHNISITKKIKVPVALAISKFDEVELAASHVRGLKVFEHSEPSREFDVEGANNISGEVESLLNFYNCDEIVSQLKNNVEHHSFFGITATGCRPEGGRFPKVAPRRVEDPLLWILNKLEFLPSKRK